MKTLKTLSLSLLLTVAWQVSLSAESPQKHASEKSNLSSDFILKKLKSWDAKLTSLKTDFFQEINFKEAGLKKNIQGKMQYLKPNYLKINHLAPEQQTIVTDKKILWIYKPSDAQVIKTYWKKWFKQNNQLSGILDFGNYAELVKNNDVKIKTDKAAEIIIDFVSKKNPSLYKLTLRLSATDYFPLGAVLALDNTIISTELQNTEKNIYISSGAFKFTPPKNAEILEFGDFNE